MKHLQALSLFLLVSTLVAAQGPLAYDGNQFNLSSGYTTNGIPVNLSFEFGWGEDYSLGIEGSYRLYDETLDNRDFDHGIFGFAIFGNYHFNTMLKLPDQWNVYAGANVGFYKWFSEEGYLEYSNSRNSSTLGVGIQIGGRYYFNDNFGVFLEGQGGTEVVGGRLGVSYLFY